MKKKNIKKILSVLMSVLMLLCVVQPIAFAVEASRVNYMIDNPYDEIDWDTWGDYKTQLHCHTTASDGFLTIDEFVRMHYAANFDIVALTDHGTINQGWNVVPETVPLMRLIKKERTKMADIIPIPQDEYEAYLDGTNDNRTYVTSDGITLTRTKENGMLDVPKGIELNMATPFADCHLTGYFSDYGQGLAGVFGDYETPSKGVMDAGGFSYLSHVGEYVYIDKDSADHVGQPVDEFMQTSSQDFSLIMPAPLSVWASTVPPMHTHVVTVFCTTRFCRRPSPTVSCRGATPLPILTVNPPSTMPTPCAGCPN